MNYETWQIVFAAVAAAPVVAWLIAKALSRGWHQEKMNSITRFEKKRRNP